MTRSNLYLSMFLCLCFGYGSLLTVAQSKPETAGISINDPLIISKCAGCHTRDTSGMMKRISYVRTTPEIWEQIIKRMVRLNGLVTTPEEARQIVRYLSTNNGLAPQEAQAAFWDAEHRSFHTQEEEAGVPAELQRTCNYCHTVGRVLLQRRTPEDYIRLANTHMALFPGSETAVFKPNRRYTNPADIPVALSQAGAGYGVLNYPPIPPQTDTPSTSAPSQTGYGTAAQSASAMKQSKYPIDLALEYLSANQPLITPEWTAWKAKMTTPKLAGKWLISAYQEGKGKVYGEITIEPSSTPDDFSTKTVLHYSDGQSISRTGKGVIYTGYSWRGHSTSTPAHPDDPTYPADTREAMLLSADGKSMEGRWFWGGYQEFGLDVRLTRIEQAPTVLGFDRYAMQSPSSGELHVYGGNLTAALKPSDFDLGTGVKVVKILRSSATEAVVQVAVDAGLPSSAHSLMIKGVTAPQTLMIYDKVSYIKVSPNASFARLGGTITAKQFANFQAIGYIDGPDGISGTADDISLGALPAKWSLEEFYSTPTDDDVKYVGTINQSGLFTPSLEGPNPKRQKQVNNYPTENWGDVWVDASYETASGQTLKARSYLVVTIPTYVRYDQPEVSQ